MPQNQRVTATMALYSTAGIGLKESLHRVFVDYSVSLSNVGTLLLSHILSRAAITVL